MTHDSRMAVAIINPAADPATPASFGRSISRIDMECPARASSNLLADTGGPRGCASSVPAPARAVANAENPDVATDETIARRGRSGLEPNSRTKPDALPEGCVPEIPAQCGKMRRAAGTFPGAPLAVAKT